MATGEVGLVMFALEEDFGAFAKDEACYVVLWILMEKVLYLANASARLNCNSKDLSNNQVFVQNELTKKEGLCEGLTDEERVVKVDEFMLAQMALADVETPKWFVGEELVNNLNSVILSKSNVRVASADYEGCVVSSMAKRGESRPMAHRLYIAGFFIIF